MSLLVTHGLGKSFGGLRAVENLDLEVSSGQIVSIIGPNGAGKTTCFNCLTGLLPATHGRVEFNGHDITRCRPHTVTELGMARTFQNIRLFGEMTALENVMVGAHARTRAGVFDAVFGLPRARREERSNANAAMAGLEFVGLADKRDVWARHLAYGNQRRLEIARALATEPRLLLLDEPGAGMNPREIEGIIELIRAIRDRGVTVLLIEHHMAVVMGISDRIIVLDHGEKIAEGNPAEVRANPTVVEAYLGKPHEP